MGGRRSVGKGKQTKQHAVALLTRGSVGDLLVAVGVTIDGYYG